jgi:ATP-binding cassette subfamily C exporter for protease/lipase
MTHRTSVLAVADKMLILRDGNMQAFGPRDDVLAALQKANEQVAIANAQAQARAQGQVAPAA